MGERTVLLLLIIFIMAGIFTFDRYVVTVKGELSPIARFIDYAGLSKLLDIKKKNIEEDYATFHVNTHDNLRRWNEAVNNLNEQRNKMHQKRMGILKSFKEINDKVAEEAEVYFKVIDKEKAIFMEKYSELKQLGDQIFSMRKISDPLKIQEEYKDTKRKLLEVFDSADSDYLKNADYLVEIFNKMDEVVFSDGSDDFEDCFNKEHCLSKIVKEIENGFMDIFERKNNKPARDVNEIIQISKGLDYENRLLARNSVATDQAFAVKEDRIDSEMKHLVENLVEVSEEDFVIFMKLYEKIQWEQRRLMKNLEDNRRRFVDYNEFSQGRLKQLLVDIGHQNEINFTKLRDVYSYFIPKSQELLVVFNVNEDSIYKLLNERKIENDDFVSNIAESVDVDLDMILDRWEREEKEKGRNLILQYGEEELFKSKVKYTIDSDRRSRNSLRSPTDNYSSQNIAVNNDYKQNLRDQRQKQRDLQEQLKRAAQDRKAYSSENDYRNNYSYQNYKNTISGYEMNDYHSNTDYELPAYDNASSSTNSDLKAKMREQRQLQRDVQENFRRAREQAKDSKYSQ